MKFVFNLDGVICTPPKGIQFGVIQYIEHSKPIANAIEFIRWLYKNHEIVIWTNRPNDLAVKFATEQWLDLHQVKYHRLIFDRPDDAVYVNETPSNAKYYAYDDDVKVVAELFEEWKKEWNNNGKERHSKIS